MISDVGYLIENHMYVPVLHTLPKHISDPIVNHPHFPELIDLGMCDTQSSYGNLQDIQKVKRVFKKFLRS